LLKRIENGDGEPEHIPMLEHMCKSLWNAYCAFAPGAIAPVESLLKHFEDEVQEHINQKKCPFK
jgi:NADH-quinone oxidoreductase subunit F